MTELILEISKGLGEVSKNNEFGLRQAIQPMSTSVSPKVGSIDGS